MKYTYLMEPEKIKHELGDLWRRYFKIINKKKPTWDEVNEARAILFLTGQIYCEKIAVEAIKRRLHLLRKRLTILEFLELIDGDSKKLKALRKDKMFSKLEKFYKIIKEYKNKYIKGKYYLEEEKFIKIYEKVNPNKKLKIGYRGSFSNR